MDRRPARAQEDVVVGSSSQSFNPLILRLPPLHPDTTFRQLVQKTIEVRPPAWTQRCGRKCYCCNCYCY